MLERNIEKCGEAKIFAKAIVLIWGTDIYMQRQNKVFHTHTHTHSHIYIIILLCILHNTIIITAIVKDSIVLPGLAQPL